MGKNFLHPLSPAFRMGYPIIDARAKGKPISPPADDGEFLRRITLDLPGRIPTLPETRTFLADRAADQPIRRIDALLAIADYWRACRNGSRGDFVPLTLTRRFSEVEVMELPPASEDSLFLLRWARPIPHNANPNEGDACSGYIRKVRTVAIEIPAPQKGKNDEEAAIHGIDTTKVSCLKGGDDAVDDDDEATDQPPTMQGVPLEATSK